MAGDMADKVRENYFRRQAKRLGLMLKKSHIKKWHYDNQGGYMIINPSMNAVIWGGKFELDLDEVEELLNNYEESQK